MFHSAPARPGKQPVHGVASIGPVAARVTWKTSLASSGSEICLAAAASSPAEETSAATPAVVGMAVDVEPSPVDTLNREWAPYEVSVERERNVLAFRSPGSDSPLRLDSSDTTELPGHTCGKRIPSVWSADSKSLEAHAITAPCL